MVGTPDGPVESGASQGNTELVCTVFVLLIAASVNTPPIPELLRCYRLESTCYQSATSLFVTCDIQLYSHCQLFQ